MKFTQWLKNKENLGENWKVGMEIPTDSAAPGGEALQRVTFILDKIKQFVKNPQEQQAEELSHLIMLITNNWYKTKENYVHATDRKYMADHVIMWLLRLKDSIEQMKFYYNSTKENIIRDTDIAIDSLSRH